MAPALGKRTRRDQITDIKINHESAADDEPVNLQAVFRQHFESTFEPLPGSFTRPPIIHNIDAKASDEELESDWDGFSDQGDKDAETVHYDISAPSKVDVSENELKIYMSAKPPSSATPIESTAKRKQPRSIDDDESFTDAANLKKDLALQRLLKESHLLDPQSSLAHSGRNRHRASELRLQDMGSKTSVFAQQKMPFAQRKGIAAKATEREELRRREARENGIILEKAAKSKKDVSMRQRGIGAPSVGKFQGGMLKLSKKDVAQIEGPKKTARRKR